MPGASRPVPALVGCALVALSLPGAARPAEDAIPCPPSGDAVVVQTASRRLWLCAAGVPAARYAVALGRGGTGKRLRGDARTPLGTYPLGAPRPSTRYGTFIPIAYPTPAQAARGFTGSAVGIHGPPRGFEGQDALVTSSDWTLGCIATGSDEVVGAIAQFVRARRPSVVIR